MYIHEFIFATSNIQSNYMKKSALLLAAVLFAAGLQAQTNWTLDKTHSNIGFSVRHMMIAEVSGLFRECDVKVSSPAADFNGASIEFVAKVASIDTQNANRDGHLKSDDFFSAEKFPEIKFTGKLVKKGKKYSAVGKLTLRDVTKDVNFPVEYLGSIKTAKGSKAGFKLTGSINRIEYGLKYNSVLETGGVAVGEVVNLAANLELNQSAN